MVPIPTAEIEGGNSAGGEVQPQAERGQTEGQARTEGGVQALPPAFQSAEPKRGEDQATPPEAETAAAPTRDAKSLEIVEANPNGHANSGLNRGNGKPISREEFRAIVVASNGNIRIIAATLGAKENTVRHRIGADPELTALFSAKNPPPPTVASPVTKTELDTYRMALGVYGVSEKHMEKLKALDGLAVGGDRLLAVSFRVSHQCHVGMLHHLDEVADSIKARLKGSEMQDGSFKPLENEDFAALSRVYIECVKERGRGAMLMLKGIEAIERMTSAAKRDENGAQPKATPGWGPMKKVRPAETTTNGND